MSVVYPLLTDDEFETGQNKVVLINYCFGFPAGFFSFLSPFLWTSTFGYLVVVIGPRGVKPGIGGQGRGMMMKDDGGVK